MNRNVLGPVFRFARKVVIFVSALLFLNGPHLFADYAGEWSGTTSQGENVSFTASSTAVTVFHFKLHTQTATVESTVNTTATITSDQFDISINYMPYPSQPWNTKPIIFEGTFSSGTQCTGTWRYQSGSGSWYNGTWTATKAGGVEDPPSISSQPADRTICTGSTAMLTVAAEGTTPLHYHWYQGNSGDTSVSVGTDSDTFTTPALTATTSYWVRVSNSFGTADSNTATVTVVTEGGPCDQCTILIVTPDSSEKDISGVLDILNGFPDLAVTVWDNTTGTPGSGDLAPYDVVIIGNQNLWAPLGLDAASLGDALAVYI